MKTQILNHQQVLQILKRMAFQIVERNFDSKEIVLAHISGQGKVVGDLLETFLLEITKQKIVRLSVQVDKVNPSVESVQIDYAVKFKSQSPIVMVDDVLNSGRTMLYAMMPFVERKVSKLQIAVLVDRSYKSFPLEANFIGTSLSTTLQEHVSVVFSKGKISVFLE
jgi:pyrimidine operon attenuation protein/uracil phosphoribosyltransferase